MFLGNPVVHDFDHSIVTAVLPLKGEISDNLLKPVRSFSPVKAKRRFELNAVREGRPKFF